MALVGVGIAVSDLKDLAEAEMLETIESAFVAQFEDELYDYDGEFSFDALSEYLYKSFTLEALGWELTPSDSYGGEGQGDSYWYVFKVSDGKTVRHVKVDGWYASYSGGEYDTWYEVFPKQKQVTVWEQ